MSTRVQNSMSHLYQRLEAIGIKKSYARAIALPSGWNDDAAENPAVYSQAIGLLARNLNLDLRTLQNSDAQIAWKNCGPTRFKAPQGQAEEDMVQAKCLAGRAAQVASSAMSNVPATLPDSAANVREAVLSAAESGVVNFQNLLDYCWRLGIPVLHISKFPASSKKPHALATMYEGRPAIVLCKSHKYSAWMLFELAHELGHIVLGHLKTGEILLDQKIDIGSKDVQEEQANQFAVELLTGKPDIRYQAGFALNAQQLAQSAISAGLRDNVDPGVIALNYAWNRRSYPVANAALAIIDPQPDPLSLIRERVNQHLDWELAGNENRAFLQRIAELV